MLVNRITSSIRRREHTQLSARQPRTNDIKFRKKNVVAELIGGPNAEGARRARCTILTGNDKNTQ